MKEEDIKALINAVKKEFQQEITTLNERIKHLEQQNLNLNTFIQHHFERLDRKTDENHQYILNTWNPFMQSTIEGVKNDLIQAMDSNKKDDNELCKRVDTLAIQVSDLNKSVFDQGFVNIFTSDAFLIKKNIEVLDLFDRDIYHNPKLYDIDKCSIGGDYRQLILNINNLNFFPKLKKIFLSKILILNNNYEDYCDTEYSKVTIQPHPTIFFSLDNIDDKYFSKINFLFNISNKKDTSHNSILLPCIKPNLLLACTRNIKIASHFIELREYSYRCYRYYQKQLEEMRNEQIDILKQYIQTNFPHIEII
jgi:polyhydroxyalkanoate synthesis regulator phasin